MSNCIRGLYDIDLVKECFRCKKILLKSNFNKNKTKRDGYRSDCRLCSKEYYYNNRDRLLNKQKFYNKEYHDQRNEYQKKYYLDNRDQIIENHKNYKKQNREKVDIYEKNERKTYLHYEIACNLRSRSNKAFKAQNVRKKNKTFDLLGYSHSFFKRWIIHQLYGNMTLEIYGSVWQFHHCLLIASFNLLDENDVKKYFNWLNLRPMYSNENNSKKVKVDMRLYLLQEIKGKYFMKINEEGLN